ncbi:MAG: arylsulfatase [bacterium]|nr:arylsulfatase [bacterium]
MLCACRAATPNQETVRTPPNIVLIYADDLGYGDLGCYGAEHVRTPNIDALASNGRRFTDAHSPSSVCSPSRYGLMTGRYPVRRNLWGPIGRELPLCIDRERLTLASVLKSAGYDTACIGKWHLGFGTEGPDWNGKLAPGPLELGFDRYFGLPVVNSSPPYVYVEDHHVVGLDPLDPIVKGVRSATQEWPAKGGYQALGGGRRAHELYADELVATTFQERAVAWLERTGERPFFLYLATTNIHHPFTPAPRFRGSSTCGRYGDFIHELDWMVGEVMAALDASGEAENTLVVFTSDNGGMLNAGGQDAWRAGHRLNGDLLGFKFGAWEGGHRVPMIARWPGRIPAGTESDALISQVDLLASFASAAGVSVPEGEAEDSLDQLAAFVGDPARPVREELIVSPNRPSHLLVRKKQWAYIAARGEGGFGQKNVGDHCFGGGAVLPFTGQENSDFADGRLETAAPPGQLYDLNEDPGQTTNVYAKHPDVVAELEAVLDGYRATAQPGKPLGWIDRR